jgi:uncharacterized protein YkwD
MTKLSLFFGLLATVSNFTSTTVTTRPPAMMSDSGAVMMTQQELQFVELVNGERAGRGLPQLTVDPLLIKVARDHSREMSDKRYFSHISPTAGIRGPMDRYLAGAKRRPSWALIGENLFYCSIVDVERGHVALMNSPGHRANILEGRFERIGVGAYTDTDGEFYVTEMFLSKAD